MLNFGKMPRKQTLMYVAIALLFVAAFMCMRSGSAPINGMALYKSKPKTRRTSRYAPTATPKTMGEPGVMGLDISSMDEMNYAPSNMKNSSTEMQTSCATAGGVGLASSLLPREVASADNFGEFAPQDILKGQSFLSSREQVGIPETLGGALRNANQQIRSEPPAPKKAYTWLNSTIVPDTMQRPLI